MKICTLLLAGLLMIESALATTPKLSAKEFIDSLKIDIELAGNEPERQKVIISHLESLQMSLEEMPAEEAQAFQLDLIKLAHPGVAKDLAEIMKVIDIEKLTSDEKAKLMIQIAESHGLKGASWNGETIGMIIAGTVALAIVGFMLYRVGCLAVMALSTERPNCASGKPIN